MKLLKLYLITIPFFLVIDLIWLGLVANSFYKKEMGSLLRKTGENMDPIWWAAILVYLVIPLGIVLFVSPYLEKDNSLLNAIKWGFIYGATLYAVYDFTNYSLVQNWSLKMSLVDVLWGGFLAAVTSIWMSYFIK